MHGASLHTVLLGFRFLQKQPLYAGLCILNLALGIGGVAAVFGVADPIVFRTLDVRSPQDLILVGTSSRDTGRVPFVPMGLWQRLREQSATLTDAMAQVGPADPVSLGDGRAATDEVRVGWVSDNFLSGLGVPVQLGRVIDARDRAATERTVVISDRLWRRRFGGDRDVPGRRISLDLPIDGRTEITIVGVAAPGFAGVVADFPQDAWLPIAQAPGIGSLPLVQMLGRPEDGISREEIVTEINYLFAQMDEDDTRVPYVESGSKGFSSLRSTHAQPLLSLGGLTALILMVACANVVALQLVTNGRRQQALATRMALGAPPLFIAMEIVAQGVFLVACAAFTALLVAPWSSAIIVALLPDSARLAAEVVISKRLLAFGVLVAAATTVTTSALPAWRASRVDVNAVLQKRRRNAWLGESWTLQRWIVGGQIAVSFAVALVGVQSLREFNQARALDTGMSVASVLQFAVRPRVDAPSSDIADVVRNDIGEAVFSRLDEVPGVEARTQYVSQGLFAGAHRVDTVSIGEQGLLGPVSEVSVFRIGPDMFSTLGVLLLMGRDFVEEDRLREPDPFARYNPDRERQTAEGLARAIIGKSMSDHFFGGDNPVGRTLRSGEELIEIVGVVEDLVLPLGPGEPEWIMYRMNDTAAAWSNVFVVRTRAAAAEVVSHLEALVQSIDSRWRVAEVQAVEDIIEGTHVEERSMAAIGVWGTGLALLLMGFGIYGMVGADVAMRQREFAIRAALGSSPLRLLMVVVRSTACVLALGIACGVLVALIVVPSSGAAMVVSSEGVVVACAIALTLGAGVAGVILPLCRVLRMRGDSLLRV